MCYINSFELDRHITGNFGEDQYSDEIDEKSYKAWIDGLDMDDILNIMNWTIFDAMNYVLQYSEEQKERVLTERDLIEDIERDYKQVFEESYLEQQ